MHQSLLDETLPEFAPDLILPLGKLYQECLDKSEERKNIIRKIEEKQEEIQSFKNKIVVEESKNEDEILNSAHEMLKNEKLEDALKHINSFKYKHKSSEKI